MDLHEALYTTRAMRRLRPDPVPEAVQARILDAAIRAPTIGEGWRFVLVDDPDLKARLASLYRQGWVRLFADYGVSLADATADPGPMGRAARSGDHLARHFGEVPLLLVGCARTRDGSGIYPALWSAMLAARAEGVGSTLTGVLHSYHASEVLELLGAPADAGWHLHGVVAMGYPTGRWGVAPRSSVDRVAARNGWDGPLGFSVPEPLWGPERA